MLAPVLVSVLVLEMASVSAQEMAPDRTVCYFHGKNMVVSCLGHPYNNSPCHIHHFLLKIIDMYLLLRISSFY